MNKKELLQEIKSLKQDLEERTLTYVTDGDPYDRGYDDALQYVLLELQEVIGNA